MCADPSEHRMENSAQCFCYLFAIGKIRHNKYNEVERMSDCMVCHEVITQPLCATCHEQQVAAWLMERCPERPELLLQLVDRREELEGMHGSTSCIKCKGTMDLCSYCYTLHIFSWVKSILPESCEEFARIFFDGCDRAHIEERLTPRVVQIVV